MVLLGILLIGYFFFTRQAQIQMEAQQKHIKDSIAAVQAQSTNEVAVADSTSADTTVAPTLKVGGLVQNGVAKEELTTVENDVMAITFTNKGGQPKSVKLKKYRATDSSDLILSSSDFNKVSYLINTGNGQTANTADLFFTASEIEKTTDGSLIRFKLADSTGKSIEHIYSLNNGDYMLGWNINAVGADKLFTGNAINLLWQVQADQQERDIKSEKRETQLGLYGAEGYDYFTMSDGLNKRWEDGLKWLSLKQKFFNTTIIAENGFSLAEINCKVPDDSTKVVAQGIANLKSTFPAGSVANIPFKLYVGPNDYAILKKYGNDMEDLVNLGQGVYAFVKYLNRWVVLPVFGVFSKWFMNYGLAIMFLTIFIRILTSPLVYSSYVSGAKMRALKPELDALKAKFGGDQQAFSMEQMKLYRIAGVNPLGGCIPALLQIPIFFSLYSFFNSNISLRGVPFLWSPDLSAYDAVLTWSFNIPGLGSHLSMFTVLAVVTSFLTSLYSISNTPDQGNPAMKYMPYIFPIMLLGIFNGLPSALTWYYTVSNVITLILQFVIMRFIINHDKILAEIEANKKKPKSKSKWQERFEQMQETQKKVNELNTKTKKK